MKMLAFTLLNTHYNNYDHLSIISLIISHGNLFFNDMILSCSQYFDENLSFVALFVIYSQGLAREKWKERMERAGIDVQEPG